MSVVVNRYFKVKSGQLSFSLPAGVYAYVEWPNWVLAHPRFTASLNNKDIIISTPPIEKVEEPKSKVSKKKEEPVKEKTSFDSEPKTEKKRGRKKKKTDDEEEK